MERFGALDLAVLVAYLAVVTFGGLWFGRGAKGGREYFLGGREIPAWLVLLSIVSTETSAITFVSVPGLAYLGNLGFLQIALGYLVGRIVVAWLLLPAYFAGELETAYALLETRFGVPVRRFASGIFLATRVLGDSVRLFTTAIPLALLSGWSYPTSIGVIAVATLVYTYAGGIRAVVWTDALQLAVYLVGALAAAAALHLAIPGGLGAAVADAHAAGKLAVVDVSPNLRREYTLAAGLVGGAFLSMASHGTDQLIVQRLLTCRDLRASRIALVGSGVIVFAQFALFLGVGIGLWAFYGGRAFERTDEIFPRFILDEMPAGLRGLLVAGVFAAAMSSLSSSVNSLSSATVYDFGWRNRRVAGRTASGATPPAARARDDTALLRAGRAWTLAWGAVLVGGATLFFALGERGSTAVEIVLGFASISYGGLLGAFALGVLRPDVGSRAAIGGMAAGIAAVAGLHLGASGLVAWPWYAAIGTLVTIATGLVAGWARRRGARTGSSATETGRPT